MGMKRSADELDAPRLRPRREHSKRMKLSPSVQHASNSSDPSSCSVSEDSALQSSPPVSEHTRQSSVSSVQPSNYDNESETSSSSSSSLSLVSESSEEIVTLRGARKPEMGHDQVTSGAQDLRARLASFLPQLQEANDLLTVGQTEVQNMEDVGEDEQHIEMNLALGVLEEKDDGEDEHSSESDSQSEEEAEKDIPASSGRAKRLPEDQEASVMGKLMGRPKGRRKVDIEDLG